MRIDWLLNIFCREQGEEYYCSALNGESDYNISINCDMTVSCNCQDYDGSGLLGDLDFNTFEEIFTGATAQRFRRELIAGKLPTTYCSGCPELKKAEQGKRNKYLHHYSLPKRGIMVENTVRCNFQCKFCSREQAAKNRRRPQMSLAEIEKVALTIKRLDLNDIYYHKLGESLLSPTFSEEIAILKNHAPRTGILMSTNGVLLDTLAKFEASLRLRHIFFSIDGPYQNILTKYQIGGNFDRSYANMKAIIDERNKRQQVTPYVEWKYVVFSWNDSDEHIMNAIELAKEAGVDIISFQIGGAPSEYFSKRYYEADFFRDLGVPSWRGREIDFRDQHADAR